LSQIVEAATAATLATSGSPSLLGSSVVFSASVPAGANGQPTGTVDFLDNGTEFGTGTLDGSGNTTLTSSTLALGLHPITAVYIGDSLNAGSASAVVTQDVLEQTHVTVLSSLNPSQPGALVTFTATLSTTGPGTPSGTVTFRDGGTALGTGTLSTAGGITTATFATSSLAVGAHSITAAYAGDPSNAVSTSVALTQEVAQVTTVEITSSSNPSIFGSSVTLTANVTPANSTTPTGTVTFFDGNTSLATGTLNGSGSASISLSNLSPAQHQITAVYSGDVNSSASTSTVLVQTVQQNTATALVVSVNPSISGNSITFTATVTASVSGTPTGAVAFSDSGTPLGSGALNSSGVATLSISTLTLGSHSILAVYAGDAVNLTSTSTALVQMVVENTSMTLTASSNPAPAGTFIIFTATVVPGSSGTPTGTVTFQDGTATLGTSTLSASGVATFATEGLGAGSHSILATYGGDANNRPSSATLMLTVTQAMTTITWATPAAVTFGTVLSGTQLDATASVPGTFVYSPAAGTTPAAGTDQLSVTFTPTDTVDYTASAASVSLTVNKATPVITWATPAAIAPGTALGATQLDATTPVPGTFVYAPAAGSTPSTGTDMLSVTFTPTDTADYSMATASVVLTVNNKTAPTVSWTTPAAIESGTTLSATQLNATASVAGSFVYTPAAGTTPADGTDILSVTFTPTDAAGFNTATASVTLAVDDFNLGGNGVSSQTVTAGGVASFGLTVSPTGSTTLLDPVGLSISGLPQGATFTFSPVTVPGGSPSTAVSLVIQTGESSAKFDSEPDEHAPHGGTPILLLVLLPPLFGMKSVRKRIPSGLRLLAMSLFVLLSVSTVAGLGGCAGQPPRLARHAGKTYNLVVTATSGTLHHSLPLTLVVQN
jgi:hypothetical protein